MFKNMPKEVKEEIKSRLISIITTSIFLIVMTWFWYGPRANLVTSQKVMGNFQQTLTMEEKNNGIILENAIPVRDSVGQNIEPYQFVVTNQSSDNLKVGLYFINDLDAIKKDGCEVLDNNYIRYTVSNDGMNYSKPRNLNIDGLMYVDTLAPSEQKTYQLKFWLDEDSGNEIMNKHFHAKVAADEMHLELATK